MPCFRLTLTPRLAGLAALAGLGACVSSEPISQAAAERQICLHHHQNSPEEQARCRLDPALRHGPLPEMTAKELPVRTERRN